MTNAHSKTGQMAVCCLNLMLGALSSRSMLSVLVGMLFKKFGLFLNTLCMCSCSHVVTCKDMANMSAVETMETGKYIQYMPLSLIMNDYKLVNTNVFLNTMQPICDRIYENKSPIFLICIDTHTHTYRII